MRASDQKVLIVDDNPSDRALVMALLERKYRVLSASDAAAGLDIYRTERPDCVLLDHNLPGTAGLDAIDSYVAEGAAVVMLTGSGSDELAAEAFKRGARDYVQKRGLSRNMLERIVARELERRRLELDLRRAQERLQLAEKLEAIGQLAAGIAHEINTPTQYVSDNIAFVADAVADLVPVLEAFKALTDEPGREHLRALAAEADLDYLIAEMPAALRSAKAGIRQITKIVLAMKEFSHPGDEMQRIDLNHAVASTATVTRNEWKYVAELALDLDPGLPPVTCHPSEINQVLLNLIVNAAHAVGDAYSGGERKGTIRIGTRRDGRNVVVAVEDDGCGIPAEIRHRIFDPFFTTKPTGKGTGQGLAIVHRIVTNHHGGEIDVHSSPGKGTRFELRLPIGEPDDEVST